MNIESGFFILPSAAAMLFSKLLSLLILSVSVGIACGAESASMDAGLGGNDFSPVVQPLPNQVVRALPGQIVKPLPGQLVSLLPSQVVRPLPGQVVSALPGQVVSPLPGQVRNRKLAWTINLSKAEAFRVAVAAAPRSYADAAGR
ncbi:MAG: hypothetical protein WCF18_05735 [Chthoniobacteraceae bacterium]